MSGIRPYESLRKQWDEVVWTSDATFWHTTHWLDYQGAMSDKHKNKSFGVVRDKKLVAICPLIITDAGVIGTNHNDPCPGMSYLEILSIAELSAVADEYTRIIDKEAVDGYTFWTNQFEQLGGDHETFGETRVINLLETPEKLWAGTRKSYHSLINKGLKEHVVVSDLSGNLMWGCRELHFKESGRRTRSDETWFLMRQWVDRGNAVLIVASDMKGVIIGYGFWVFWNNWAYYASAAGEQLHAIQWAGMVELKRRGIRDYEIGWQGVATDQKGKDIEFFRSGFGVGTNVTRQVYTWPNRANGRA